MEANNVVDGKALQDSYKEARKADSKYSITVLSSGISNGTITIIAQFSYAAGSKLHCHYEMGELSAGGEWVFSELTKKPTVKR